MFRNIFGIFKKEPEPDETVKEIELSKIDKHMNFILRNNLGVLNRIISQKVIDIDEKKEEILHKLRGLHKKPLVNPNIPQREVQIMEGNRENYVKRVSHFVSNIEMPKNYLESYDYCSKYFQDFDMLIKDTQKNVFILNNFFENEVKAINRELNELSQTIIDMKTTFENNNIQALKDVEEKIRGISKNLVRVKELEGSISEERAAIKEQEDRIAKLRERINTIMSGTDYRTLENFKEEKENVESEMKKILSGLQHNFSEIETGLKKYFYRNPDKKIIRAYFDDLKAAILSDNNLEITQIFSELKENVSTGAIELKDKKQATTLEALENLSYERLKEIQSGMKKLDDQRSHSQTKITHNSAQLNLSEQQYWINAALEKVDAHKKNIEKFTSEINHIKKQDDSMIEDIKSGLEKIMGETVIIRDDLHLILEKEG